MNIKDKLFEIKKSFEKNHVLESELSARLLVADVLSIEPINLFFNYNQSLTKDQELKLDNYISRRLKHEPVSYIVGYKNFRGKDFIVNQDVLIPRPETEYLVDLIIPFIDDETVVFDIGTGSGCIAISLLLETKKCFVTAVDFDDKVLGIAKQNSQKLLDKKQIKKIEFEKYDILKKDLYEYLKYFFKFKNSRNCIFVANLPYIPENEKFNMDTDVVDFEPGIALFGGTDGDSLILPFLKNLFKIKAKSLIFLEIDPDNLKNLTEFLNFQKCEYQIIKDLNQINRYIKIDRR